MAENQVQAETPKGPIVPADILSKFDNTVEFKDAVFRFKKDKLGVQRARVELKLPVPSVEGLVSIITKGQTPEGKKGLDLLLEACQSVVRSVAADYVGDNEDVNVQNFPYEKMGWDAIANMPREDRRSSSIAAETWESFAKDYADIMPAITSKTAEQIGNAIIVFRKKFSIVKQDKKTIEKLQQQLGLYMEHTKNGEEFEEILTLLNEKADVFLKSNTVEQLVANL